MKEIKDNEIKDNEIKDNEIKDNEIKDNEIKDNLLNEFKYLNDHITLFKMQLNTIQQHLKSLEKNVKKELKKSNKATTNKNKIKKGPSGFAKPTKVSKELCHFMNIPEGSEIARTEVTKHLVQYIKQNNLQEQTNKSKNKIIPDDKLCNLLGFSKEEKSDELTFFNIQKYMNKHFINYI
jgi:chromatin remodeling complex protein RSC6